MRAGLDFRLILSKCINLLVYVGEDIYIKIWCERVIIPFTRGGGLEAEDADAVACGTSGYHHRLIDETMVFIDVVRVVCIDYVRLELDYGFRDSVIKFTMRHGVELGGGEVKAYSRSDVKYFIDFKCFHSLLRGVFKTPLRFMT